MQEVGYYLHREGPSLGKHHVRCLLLPSALDAQFGTPYPRSAGFDTDTCTFIESSAVLSPPGRMSHPVFKDGTIAEGALSIGQTLRLGGFLMTPVRPLR